MKVVSLDVDSSERDPTVYPFPNDYTVRLNKRLYGVTKLTLTAARIPNCQALINANNDSIQIDGVVHRIPHGTYTNGQDLASNVQIALQGSNVTSVVYVPATSNLVFSNVGTSNLFQLQFFNGGTTGTAATVLGFNGSNVSTTGTPISSGPVDLTGAPSLFVRVTLGADDLDRDVFVNGGTFTIGSVGGLAQKVAQIPPHYIGRIVLDTLGETHLYNLTDAPITYDVPSLNVDDIRIRLYWNNGSKLVPYDFGSRNHILKFDITCETDRFLKVYEDATDLLELPPPVPESPDGEPTRISPYFLGVAVILMLGLVFLLFTGPSPRTPAAGA